jgi:hypothetical protein
MMIKAARIENGVVRDLWMVPSLDAFEGITLVSAPDGVAIGYLYDGSTFTAPEPTAQDTEQKALEIRYLRDIKLTESDWTQMPDISAERKSLWATYRQALRDVPTQSGFPWGVQWPTKPE